MKKLLLFVLATATTLSAQITSGTLTGTAKDVSGNTVSNAMVTVFFVPTAQKIVTHTNEMGKFTLTNLKPGNPYTITVASIGYRPNTVTDISVELGKTTSHDIVLEKAVVSLKGIEIISDAASDARKQGYTTQVTDEQIAKLPVLSRSFQDITRLSPQGNGVSFAGSNYRYNNLTIDGAVSNDVFGFSQSSGQSTASTPTGTPGSLSRSQPISLDAIEQVSVAIAPFDVKIGNFTGGSINAVTKYGTNTTHGTVYSFARNSALMGEGVSGKIPNDFKEYQIGASVGGKIVKDKLFYFANAEVSRRTDPVLFGAGTSGVLLTAPIATQVRDSLVSFASRSNVVNYDAGTIGAYSNSANSEKYLVRFDWNLGKSVLTLRNNFVNASAENLERGQLLNKLASQDFTHFSQTNGTVLEVKTQVSDNISNNFLMGLTQVSDHRTPYGTITAPQIEIQDIQYGQINAGSDREATVYKQHTKTIELTNNLTWTLNRHIITAGTHNEFYNIEYTFLNSYNGRWQYPNLAAFLKGQPNRIRATVGNPDVAGADFRVVAPSAYLQDEISLLRNLKVSVGIRVDETFTDKANQLASFGALTVTDGSKPYAKYTGDYTHSLFISPRLGFVWDVRDNVIVRGGAGTFQGRMPFAWFAYPFIQNGITTSTVDYRPSFTSTFTSVPLIIQADKQKTINTLYNQGSVYEINLIDNKFVQPQMARGNLAIDIKLPAQTTFSLEGIYTKTINDILFTNQGLPSAAGNLGGSDTRPIYSATRLAAAVNPFSAVYVLSNTNLGYRYNITASLMKKGKTVEGSVAYSYGEAKDVANGQRNSPQSNVEYNQLVTANVYPLTWSNYDVRHRIVSTLTWHNTKGTLISAVYTGASGTPYSYVYSGDLNGDGSSNNDLMFIPKTITDIKLVASARPTGQVDTRTPDQIWADLNAFISNDPYLSQHRGEYTQRNGARTPWNHKVDVRFAQDIGKIQLTLDVSNIGNMINKEWGKSYFVPNLNNQNVYPIQYRSGRAVGSVPSFSFDPMTTTYQQDDVLSRWQMQVGARIRF